MRFFGVVPSQVDCRPNDPLLISIFKTRRPRKWTDDRAILFAPDLTIKHLDLVVSLVIPRYYYCRQLSFAFTASLEFASLCRPFAEYFVRLIVVASL